MNHLKSTKKHLRFKLIFKYVQANINLRNSIFPFLSQVMFHFKGKIYVIMNLKNQSSKKDVLCKRICKLRFFLNREITVHILKGTLRCLIGSPLIYFPQNHSFKVCTGILSIQYIVMKSIIHNV